MDVENRWGLRRGRRIRPPFKKKNRHAIRRNDFLGGGRWIRTTEVTDNRFTVCPLWPLGNSPIFTLLRCGKIGAGRRTRTPDLLITKSRKILKISFSGRFLIVFAGIEILFHVPVSTASVRSFPRVGHGVGQPFLQVRHVKTPPNTIS